MSCQKSVCNSRISKCKFPHSSWSKIYFFWSSIFKTLVSKHCCTSTKDLNSLTQIPSSSPQIRALADAFYSTVLLPLKTAPTLLDSSFTEDFRLTDKPCIHYHLLTRSPHDSYANRNFLMCNLEIGRKKKDMSGVNIHRETL